MKSTKTLWPEDYQVDPDHCGDVLRGSYDLPFDPSSPPVVLDIGSNIGAFAVWASTRWPGCILHCYEPHPNNFQLLERTLQDHHVPNVTARQTAVSSEDGMAELSEGLNSCGEGSIVMQYPGTASIVVPTMSARHLPQADVLKLDCEGSELVILEELFRTRRLAQFSAIMLETHSEHDRQRIMSLLGEADFVRMKEKRWHADRSELRYLRRDLVPSFHAEPDPAPAPEKPLVWIATPLRELQSKGLITQDDFDSLAEHYREPIRTLCVGNNLPWKFQLYLAGGGGVARARNRIVKDFLASGAEYLFFVDYDLMPKPQD